MFDTTIQEDAMTVASHVEELRKKHQNLSAAVERAQRSPGTSDHEIAAMKREKLRLKEQITRYAH
ncbi:YdcH family protein [Paracoccus nototheniae]